MGKESKLLSGVPWSGVTSLNCPPKSCIPSRAKMRMKRKRRKRREMMERMEERREITRFRREDQYFVTLNIRRRRRARRTDRPKDEPGLK